MRRTFTLAIAALAALLTFADAPLPKRTGATVLPQPSKIGVVAQQAKEAMAKKQLEAEKANAATQTSTSVFRTKSSRNMSAEEPIITDLTATLPYLNTFDTVDEQNEAAIYDANEDSSTFTFHADGSGNGMARYTWSGYNCADDYLVFPGVELKAGEVYEISLDAKNSGYNERLEVVAGKAAKVSAFTIQVIEPTDITQLYEFVKCSNKSFTVEEDGTYFFAVHAISYPNMYFLDIDNFSIKNNNVPEPVKVSDLAIAADPSGAKSATITFTVPNKTTSGK